MLNCIVRGCKSNSNANPDLHFFSLPKDSFARREWIEILSLRNRQVTEATRVCELHFKDKDFTSSTSGKKILKNHCVPIIKVSDVSTRSSDEDDEFMQCGSDSDPEILEVKKISKQMAANVKQERLSPPPPPPDIKKEPEEPVEQETGRRPSRRAAQLAVKKIHNTVRSLSLGQDRVMEMSENNSPAKSTSNRSTAQRSSPKESSSPAYRGARRGRRPGKREAILHVSSSPSPIQKPKFRDQKTWHAVRAPVSNVGLLMECHEELLSVPQAEALMKAQTEYNNVMKMLRALKANNVRIILETNDRPEQMPATPPPPLLPQVSSTPTVIKAQKNPGSSFMVKQANLVQTSSSGVTVVPVHLVTVQPPTSILSNMASLSSSTG